MKTYSVWVGGGEVNDRYLTAREAQDTADYYKQKGYEDVVIEDDAKSEVYCGDCLVPITECNHKGAN